MEAAKDDNIDYVLHLGDYIYEYDGPSIWTIRPLKASITKPCRRPNLPNRAGTFCMAQPLR